MTFSYKASITIDHTKCGSSNSTDFPILVSGTYAGAGGVPDLRTVGNGGHVQNANGYDIAFYSDSSLSTAMPFELELYNASTGQIIFWTKESTLSSSSDTVLYIAYGDSGITTNQSSTATWNSAYLSVWHCDDNAANKNVVDSTSNADTGASNQNTSVYSTTGKVNTGFSFSASLNDRAHGTNVINTANVTISMWTKLASLPGSGDKLFGGFADGPGSSTYDKDLIIDASNRPQFYAYDGAVKRTNNTTAMSASTWTYIVGTADSTTMRIYMGASGSSVSQVGSIACGGTFTGYSTGQAWIGSNTSGFGFLDQILDEFRVSNVVRSADWITAEFNNMDSPSTFYTMGAETPVSGAGLVGPLIRGGSLTHGALINGGRLAA